MTYLSRWTKPGVENQDNNDIKCDFFFHWTTNDSVYSLKLCGITYHNILVHFGLAWEDYQQAVIDEFPRMLAGYILGTECMSLDV